MASYYLQYSMTLPAKTSLKPNLHKALILEFLYLPQNQESKSADFDDLAAPQGGGSAWGVMNKKTRRRSIDFSLADKKSRYVMSGNMVISRWNNKPSKNSDLGRSLLASGAIAFSKNLAIAAGFGRDRVQQKLGDRARFKIRRSLWI